MADVADELVHLPPFRDDVLAGPPHELLEEPLLVQPREFPHHVDAYAVRYRKQLLQLGSRGGDGVLPELALEDRLLILLQAEPLMVQPAGDVDGAAPVDDLALGQPVVAGEDGLGGLELDLARIAIQG